MTALLQNERLFFYLLFLFFKFVLARKLKKRRNGESQTIKRKEENVLKNSSLVHVAIHRKLLLVVVLRKSGL